MRAAPVLALFAAACGPIVQIGAPAPPPAALLTLSPSPPATAPAALPKVDETRAVTLLAATAPARLQTVRIPVQISATEVQYLKGAIWSEPPAQLFVRLIGDTLASAGIAVLDRRVTGKAAPRVLGGELVAFHVEAGGTAVARVRFDATLASPDGIRQRRFEGAASIGVVEPGEVSRALNSAANTVAKEVAAWVAAEAG
ncbi:ABC-type transport auxiliary lipoprotein family protein [Thermaurantiacus sp.]